ncbi:serine hydrolase [Sporomusa acidovorans]|uniref:Serine-type D-Ala-D-Ala carboxypeptidase n=1 Tax=Sporomusa acidovorans (strain ATCC 49682 / DSM 3132 / Mol) TaxID=1123286 RepID=A0ABZ3IW92_SPOA4|nr:serine hydrolase [Sporomusa acidovorans]OZC15278.1 D-aminopeptidase [Sporomusa acidovorans DSM 3132]SDE91907.1 Copper amine oxidase N-terminal domain-containing protein [Sporomusa acidovorans]
MKKYDVAGLSAAVFTDGKLIWNGSYGWADLSTSRAVNSGTLFRVASISKMVTATALMLLYEQGKFGLDAAGKDLMHSMQWFGNGLEGFYRQKGLNFHITDDLVPGRRLIGHSGEAYGLSGDAYFDLDSKIGFVFLMNGANLTDANPFYSVETTLAKTLMTSFAPPNSNKPMQLKAKAGDTFIAVNDRKIFLQTPAAITKIGKTQHLFLPAIAAADALSAGIEQTADKASFTVGRNKATLTADQAVLTCNGEKIVLSQAPYLDKGQLLVPVRELATALNINMKLSL